VFLKQVQARYKGIVASASNKNEFSNENRQQISNLPGGQPQTGKQQISNLTGG
jgi:hypothetical protein